MPWQLLQFASILGTPFNISSGVYSALATLGFTENCPGLSIVCPINEEILDVFDSRFTMLEKALLMVMVSPAL